MSDELKMVPLRNMSYGAFIVDRYELLSVLTVVATLYVYLKEYWFFLFMPAIAFHFITYNRYRKERDEFRLLEIEVDGEWKPFDERA